MIAPKTRGKQSKKQKARNRERRSLRRNREELRLDWIKSNVGYYHWDRRLKKQGVR